MVKGLKQGYNLHHWSLDGCWLAYLLKMLGPPCMSRTLTIRNATVNTPSAAALLKSPLSHFGRLCGSGKKVRSSSIPEFRLIWMEWSRNNGTLPLPLTGCGLMNLRDCSPYRGRRTRKWHRQLQQWSPAPCSVQNRDRTSESLQATSRLRTMMENGQLTYLSMLCLKSGYSGIWLVKMSIVPIVGQTL